MSDIIPLNPPNQDQLETPEYYLHSIDEKEHESTSKEDSSNKIKILDDELSEQTQFKCNFSQTPYNS